MELRTKVVNTKFGPIYIASYWRDGHLVDNERTRFYDKDDKLLDYYENETILEWCEDEGKTEQDWIDDYSNCLMEQPTMEDLLGYMCVEYDYCGTDKEAAKKTLADAWGEALITDQELKENEYVAHIGDYIITLLDY